MYYASTTNQYWVATYLSKVPSVLPQQFIMGIVSEQKAIDKNNSYISECDVLNNKSVYLISGM